MNLTPNPDDIDLDQFEDFDSHDFWSYDRPADSGWSGPSTMMLRWPGSTAMVIVCAGVAVVAGIVIVIGSCN